MCVCVYVCVCMCVCMCVRACVCEWNKQTLIACTISSLDTFMAKCYAGNHSDCNNL